jgi:predicted nucleic acid-binding protein
MILIDTSAWLYALRRQFQPSIKDRIDSILLESEVAINGIIKLELLGGAKTEKEYKKIKSRLDNLYFIESTKKLWDMSSHLAFSLRRKGITVPFTDILNAATAISEDAVLVHTDSHFEIIADHSQLKSENLIPLLG